MTLLITVLAAVTSTVIWYMRPESKMKIGFLCLMYWGASIMWFVDAVAEYVKAGVSYFKPAAEEMLNDSFLGFSVVTLGLVIWLVLLLVKDPAGRIRAALGGK